MLTFPCRLFTFIPVIALLPLGTTQAQDPDAVTDGVRIFAPAYFAEYDPVSALQLAFRTPGFNPQEQDGGRGLSGVRSNILINGERPPPKGQSVRQQLGEMPVSAVARIELIDAGARLDIDMQGYSQVVNVVTIPNAPAYYEVISQVHRAGTGDISQENQRNLQLEAISSFSWGEHEFTLRGDTQDQSSRSPADLVAIDPANPEQRITSLNRSDQNSHGILLGAEFALPADSSLDLSTRFNSWNGGSVPISLEADDDPLNLVSQTSDNQNDQYDFSAEYRRPFGANSTIMLAIVDAQTEEQSESSLSSNGTTRSSVSDRESGETAARLLVTQPLNSQLTIRTQATTAFNYFEGDFRLFEGGIEVPVEGSDSRVEEDRHSIDASVDWNFTDRWTFQSTLGAEAYEIKSRDATSGLRTDPKGQLSITYRPKTRTTISLESTRQIGQLSFGQFLASSSLSSEIITAGAVTLEPQRSWRHAAIYDRRFGDVGVMTFELSREAVDNPVGQVALSESLVVAQNTFSQTIDQARASVEYPFESLGREDLILAVQARIRQSATIDPVTGEARDVSGVQRHNWSIELRRDPGDSRLAWNFYVSRQQNGTNYSVRRLNESQNNGNWGASVEWEPIDGLKLRTEYNGPRTETRSAIFYPAIREPGLTPSFISNTDTETDSSASFTVEWRRREHFEIRASFNTRPKVRTIESLTPYGDLMGTLLAREFASTPRATLRFRFYR